MSSLTVAVCLVCSLVTIQSCRALSNSVQNYEQQQQQSQRQQRPGLPASAPLRREQKLLEEIAQLDLGQLQLAPMATENLKTKKAESGKLLTVLEQKSKIALVQGEAAKPSKRSCDITLAAKLIGYKRFCRLEARREQASGTTAAAPVNRRPEFIAIKELEKMIEDSMNYQKGEEKLRHRG